jgi:hypothetical protein
MELLPVREPLRYGRVEPFVGFVPWGHDVGVDLPERGGLDDPVRRGPLAPRDEEPPAGVAITLGDTGEQLGTGRVRQPLLGEDDGEIRSRVVFQS